VTVQETYVLSDNFPEYALHAPRFVRKLQIPL